jgi:hypothetical protein
MSSIPNFGGGQISLGNAPSVAPAPAVPNLFSGVSGAAGASVSNFGAKLREKNLKDASLIEEERSKQVYAQNKVTYNLKKHEFLREMDNYLNDPANQGPDMLTGARTILDTFRAGINQARSGEMNSLSSLVDHGAGTSSKYNEINKQSRLNKNKLLDEFEQEITGYFANPSFVSLIESREREFLGNEKRMEVAELSKISLDTVEANPSSFQAMYDDLEESSAPLGKKVQSDVLNEFTKQSNAIMLENAIEEATLNLNLQSLEEVDSKSISSVLDSVSGIKDYYIGNIGEALGTNLASKDIDNALAGPLSDFIGEVSHVNGASDIILKKLDDNMINVVMRNNPKFRSLLGLEANAAKRDKAIREAIDRWGDETADVSNNLENSWLTDMSIGFHAKNAKKFYEASQANFNKLEDPTDKDYAKLRDIREDAAVAILFDRIAEGKSDIYNYDSGYVVDYVPDGYANAGEYFFATQILNSSGELNKIAARQIESEYSLILSQLGGSTGDKVFDATTDNIHKIKNAIVRSVNNARSSWQQDPTGFYAQMLKTKEFKEPELNATRKKDSARLIKLQGDYTALIREVNQQNNPDLSVLHEPFVELLRAQKSAYNRYGGPALHRVASKETNAFIQSALSSSDPLNELNKLYARAKLVGPHNQGHFIDSLNSVASYTKDKDAKKAIGSVMLGRIFGPEQVSFTLEGTPGSAKRPINDDEIEELEGHLGAYHEELESIFSFMGHESKKPLSAATTDAWDDFLYKHLASSKNAKDASNLIINSLKQNVVFFSDAKGIDIPIFISETESDPAKRTNWWQALITGPMKASGFDSRRMESRAVKSMLLARELGTDWFPDSLRAMTKVKVGGKPHYIIGDDDVELDLSHPRDYLAANNLKLKQNTLKNNMYWIHDTGTGMSILGLRSTGPVKGSSIDAEVLSFDGRFVEIPTNDLFKFSQDLN